MEPTKPPGTPRPAADSGIASRWPLVGRAQELEYVASMIEPPGHGVLLAGAPGVGKTRLAQEALEAARRRGWAVTGISATSATTGIPLGAVAHLVPRPAAAPSERASLIAQLVEGIVDGGSGGRIVVGVDDAHLLDELSAALVHHIAAAGIAPVVVTTRRGEPAPGPITALYKNGLVQRLELQRLSHDEVGDLLARVLGGYVPHQTVSRLWDVSGGNVLYLRELVLDALDAGTLSVAEGVWHWAGGVGPGARLSEVIGARLAGLGPPEAELVELLAVGEPVEVGLLQRIIPEADLAGLERRSIVESRASGRRIDARLAHPLYGEVVRARLGAFRRREISRLLAEQLEGTGHRRQGDLLRLALWRVHSGTAHDAGHLTAAAERANRIHDPATGELLARASLGLEASFGASLQLGAALVDQARFEEAESVLSRLSPADTDDAGRKGLAVHRMRALFYGLGRAEAAEAAVASVEAAMQQDRHKLVLRGWRCMMLSHAGRFEEAATVAVALAASEDRAARIVGVPTLAVGRILAGRVDEALALSEEGVELVGGERSLPAPMAFVRILALASAGRLAEADAVASAVFQAVPSGEQRPGEVALIDAVRGSLRLMQGRPRSALRVLRDAAVILRRHATGGFLTWCLSQQVEAAALLGDARSARAALEEATSLKEGAVHLFDGAAARARAWCPAAEGAWTAAAAELAAVGEALAARGERTEAMRAFQDAVRLGGAILAARRLGDLAASVSGPLAAACALHARAVLDGDLSAAEGAGGSFEAAGFALVAAELSAKAAALAADQGLNRRASAARRRAAELAAGCEGAVTPGLIHAEGPGRLTRREREVAHLAGLGLTNRQIAGKLVTSVRTVESHLQQVYAKLGINDRASLHRALGSRPTTGDGGTAGSASP